MSSDPFYSDPPIKQGMSGTSKVLLGLGLGCGFMLLLCCGGIFGVGFSLASYLKSSVTEEPAKIRLLTGDIVTIEIPPALAPKMGVDLEVPFTKAPFMSAVVYADEQQHATLMLTEFKIHVEDEKWRDYFKQNVDSELEKKGHRQRELRVDETKDHEITIHSEPAKFQIAKATDTENNEKFWQVTGEFKGLTGPAVLVFSARQQDFTEAQIIEMLDSMK